MKISVFSFFILGIDRLIFVCYSITVLIQFIQLGGDKVIKIDYKNDKPLHEQISIGIKELIISGILKFDEQLPSVRELSVELTVNPNTVQRAYKSLEAEGIIYSVRGKGNFVSRISEKSDVQADALYDVLEKTVKELAFLGESEERIQNVIKNIYIERDC